MPWQGSQWHGEFVQKPGQARTQTQYPEARAGRGLAVKVFDQSGQLVAWLNPCHSSFCIIALHEEDTNALLICILLRHSLQTV